MDEARAREIAESQRAEQGVRPEAVCKGVARKLIRLEDGERKRAFVVRYESDTPHTGHYVELAIGLEGELLRVQRCM